MAGIGDPIPGMDPKYLQVELKENSPARAAAVAGIPTKYLFDAEEFEIQRAFVNKLRDDVDIATTRPTKFISTATIGVAQDYKYTAQIGDDKKVIVFYDGGGDITERQFIVPINNFPDGALFIIYLLTDREHSLRYFLSTGDEASGNSLHNWEGDKTAYLRLMKGAEISILLANYTS